MMREELASVLDLTFSDALKSWGCDFVRDGMSRKPWIAVDPKSLVVYAGIIGPSRVVEEVRLGLSVLGEPIRCESPKVLTGAFWEASKKANEFPPFYVE